MRGGQLSEIPSAASASAHFNSRPRVGGDWFAWNPAPLTPYFNSRPRVGGDIEFVMEYDADYVFQFTPPAWGATTVTAAAGTTNGKFQFTPRVGGDTDEVKRSDALYS